MSECSTCDRIRGATHHGGAGQMQGSDRRGPTLRVRGMNMAISLRIVTRRAGVWLAAMAYLAVCAGLFAAGDAPAATYISRATGNWNATGTWARQRTGTI